MKKQILVIHGGTTFDTYEEYLAYLKASELTLEKITHKGWKDFLASKLTDFQVLNPKMPNFKNAKYLEWKIWFEKVLPFINNNVTLVGHSLGGIFLAKYLSENNFPKSVASLHLVAAPYDSELVIESLGDFALSGSVSSIDKVTNKIFLYYSKDDPTVPYQEVEKYQKDLPKATLIAFEDRGHFSQENFPELIENIK